MISKTGIHATLALAFLAQLQPDQFAGASSVAEQVGAPKNYLGKLLKQLTEVGLLESQKGFGGGFRLAKPATEITLFDILEPLEGVSKWDGCFLGRSTCTDNTPCVMHHKWSKIRNDYLQFLKDTTVDELASKKVTLS